VTTHYRYGGWGVQSILGSSSDPIRFGGRRDIGTLVMMGSRVYDPFVGRFLSPDPIMNPLNRYGYTLGNPIWFQDVSGDYWIFVLEAAGIIVGLTAAAATATPGVAANVAFALAAVSAAFFFAAWAIGAGGGSGGGGGGGGDGAGSAGHGVSAVPVCSPSRIGEVPQPGRLLFVLIALEAALGVALMRRRRLAAQQHRS
jgi:RHS repeat-associated protein